MKEYLFIFIENYTIKSLFIKRQSESVQPSYLENMCYRGMLES